MFNNLREWWMSSCRFRLLPRRLQSHYRDDDNILVYMQWWQWGRKCFRVRQQVFLRTYYSNWDRICGAYNRGEADAEVIHKCIAIISTHPEFSHLSHCEVYNRIIGRMAE